MKEKKPRKPKRAAGAKRVEPKWIATLFVLSTLVSVLFAFASDRLLSNSGYLVSFLVLLFIIITGILFDVLGIATATCDEKPLHSMAARKRYGAVQAIKLIRNAEKVSSFCNDVVGDICGIISGATTAAIVLQLVSRFSWNALGISLGLSGLVAGLTIVGKAIGKTFAMNYNTDIVLGMGKAIRFFSLGFRKGSSK